MQKTTNYGFPKPEDDDFFNVKDFADMMDKVDETLAKVENAGGIYIGGTNLSTEATINDEEAEYPVLSKNASSISEITLFSKSLALKIGTYSVMIRMKVSDISKTDSVISVKIRKGSYTGEIIKEIRISPNMFDANNKYKILGTPLCMPTSYKHSCRKSNTPNRAFKRLLLSRKKVKNMAGSPLPELTFRHPSVILVVLQLSQVAKARLMYSRT